MRTEDADYARRLSTLEGARWKRLLNVQALYRWNLRRYHLGVTLDVGCGIGRNMAALEPGSVGVDHNPESVAVARRRGFSALTVEEFTRSAAAAPERFDSLLVAHVLEHMGKAEGVRLLETYLPYLRSGGAVLLICPQERGFASDPTHVQWLAGSDLEDMSRAVALRPVSRRSFPLPRPAGSWFTYNESLVLARKAPE